MKLIKQPLFIIICGYLLFSLFSLSLVGMNWDEAPQHQMGRASWDFLIGQTPTINFLRDDAIYYGVIEHLVTKLFAEIGGRFLGMAYVDAYHLVLPILMIIGISCFYKLINKMFNEKTAILSTVILLLHPRLLSLSLYATKEIWLLVLNLVTLYFLYLTAKNPRWKTALIAGISYGISLGIQVSSVLVLLIFAGPAIYAAITNRHQFKNYFMTVILFLLTSLVVMFLVWPSMWLDPMLPIKSFTYFMNHGWPGQITYFGQIYQSHNVPASYPLFYIFGTLPILLIGLSIIGLVTLGHLESIKQRFEKLFILSWFFVPLAIFYFSGVIKYDGVRHYLDILPPLAVMAAIGLLSLIDFLYQLKSSFKDQLNYWIYGLFGIYLFSQLVIVLPYGDAYFNEAVQIAYPKNIDQQFEIEYWAEAYRGGIDWLNINAKPNAMVCLPLADHVLYYYSLRPDLSFGCVEKIDYLMFITRWAYIPPNLNDLYPFQNKQPVYTINRLNSDLLRIYEF